MVFSGFKAFLALSILVLSLATQASALPDTDINRDGFSDVVMVKINKDGSLLWNRVSTGAVAGSETALGSFGVNGQMLAPGAWFNNKQTHIGTVGLNGSKIIWYVRDNNGVLQSLEYGSKGMTALSGGDYNDNGIVDALTASSDGKVYIRTEAFAQLVGKTSAEFELDFGSKVAKRGKLFFLSVDGGGDLAAYLVRKRARKGFRYVLYARNVFNTLVKKRFRGSGLDKISDVFPVEGPYGVDYVGIVTKNSKRLVVTVRDIRGSIIERRSFRKGKFAITGDYFKDAGHEVAVLTSKGLKIFNPNTKNIQLYAASAGILLIMLINQILELALIMIQVILIPRILMIQAIHLKHAKNSRL
ncbi:MAG: hypothetical protein R3A13_06445 [Bdellovibrionota bacterium]